MGFGSDNFVNLSCHALSILQDQLPSAEIPEFVAHDSSPSARRVHRRPAKRIVLAWPRSSLTVETPMDQPGSIDARCALLGRLQGFPTA